MIDFLENGGQHGLEIMKIHHNARIGSAAGKAGHFHFQFAGVSVKMRAFARIGGQAVGIGKFEDLGNGQDAVVLHGDSPGQ